MTTKKCSKCGEEKPVNQFHARSESKDGLRGQCKACWNGIRNSNGRHRRAQLKYRKNNPEKCAQLDKAKEAKKPEHYKKMKHRYRLLKRYGLTIEQYNSMLETQAGQCAICGKKMKQPNIDHCHATGKVRELLCLTCNFVIGGAYEDVALLKSAIKYLERHHAAV